MRYDLTKIVEDECRACRKNSTMCLAVGDAHSKYLGLPTLSRLSLVAAPCSVTVQVQTLGLRTEFTNNASEG